MKLINIDYVLMYFDHDRINDHECKKHQAETIRIIKGQFSCFSYYTHTINNMHSGSIGLCHSTRGCYQSCILVIIMNPSCWTNS